MNILMEMLSCVVPKYCFGPDASQDHRFWPNRRLLDFLRLSSTLFLLNFNYQNLPGINNYCRNFNVQLRFGPVIRAHVKIHMICADEAVPCLIGYGMRSLGFMACNVYACMHAGY